MPELASFEIRTFATWLLKLLESWVFVVDILRFNWIYLNNSSGVVELESVISLSVVEVVVRNELFLMRNLLKLFVL